MPENRHTYRYLIDYFATLAEQHKLIKFFAHGDYAQILGAERDKISYPCLWVESPEATGEGNTDQMKLVWQIAFVVLINAPRDHFEDKQANIDTAMTIAADIIGKVREDLIEGNLLAVNFSNLRFQYVYDAEGDQDEGWRVTFSIKSTNKELCFDKEKWDIPEDV